MAFQYPVEIPGIGNAYFLRSALNAIRVHGNAVGQTVYVGRGAGGDATASAVVADLIDVARLHGADARHYVPYLGTRMDALKERKAFVTVDCAGAD